LTPHEVRDFKDPTADFIQGCPGAEQVNRELGLVVSAPSLRSLEAKEKGKNSQDAESQQTSHGGFLWKDVMGAHGAGTSHPMDAQNRLHLCTLLTV